jgi:hypothetical protein
MTGPLMVIGRETTLPSGAVDLVALARGGELLIIEFKTGPQNTDFRRVLAQLLDYGSDIWRITYEEFESTVAERYFASGACQDERLRGKRTLEEAGRAIWPDLSDEETAQLRERLTQALANGGFHYLVVAQRFIPTTLRTVEYLNATMPAARFYAVELVRFGDAALSAFESRTALKPPPPNSKVMPGNITSESQFLDAVSDEVYRDALRELLEVCRGLDLRFGWGVHGTSIRLPAADRQEPLSIGWLFKPGVSSWGGLRDLNLGYDPGSIDKTPSVRAAVNAYVARAAELSGAERVRTGNLNAYHLGPDAVVRARNQIAELLAELIRQASASA